MEPDYAGRPNPIAGHTQLLFGGMHRLQENVVINIKNKSHSVTAEIDVPDSRVAGVIIAQGGNTGGWSLYAKDGRLRYCYNVVGVSYYVVESDTPISPGTHQTRFELDYDGGGPGKGGTVSLFLDGTKVGVGRVDRTHSQIFSMDETTEGRLRRWVARLQRIRTHRQRLHRQGQVGPDRHRRRRARRRSPHRTRRTLPTRHGQAVRVAADQIDQFDGSRPGIAG